MSVPPHPFLQARIVLDTAREDLRQHLPSASDVLPQVSGEYTSSVDLPVPVPEFVADKLEDAVYQLRRRRGPDETEPLRWHSRHRRSNRAVATTRNNQVDHAVISSQDLDLPCRLNALTDGMQHIPVRDMDAWVDRPVETRRQEALQWHKRIPRPPNSFILYRLAYSDRVKYWLGRNDHQTISRLSGQSWKMEAPHIRKEYETLAEMEKRNHARAHPGYRFTLSNKQGKPRTAKGRSQELALRSKAFSNFGQDSRPAAWTPSMDNNGACERSTGTFPEEEGILIQRCFLSSDGFIPLGSAASVWEQCNLAGIRMPVAEAMSECVYGSPCEEGDFLMLFGEPTPLENPIPSVSWIEAELAEMEAKDRHDPQHYESTSGDFSVHDRQMTGSSLDYTSQDNVHHE
ncbi:hypothetical protein AnigIFM60653_002349 [Aspergillus niger]|nr:hypothetical protein AnigIFM60653_002349 [Aspergillus niger]